jgi:hypothetical protein
MQYDKNGYELRTCRVEWSVEVFVIDQYEQEDLREHLLYKRTFPDEALARTELECIAKKDPYHLRWVWKDAPHSYHDCRVVRREIRVDS